MKSQIMRAMTSGAGALLVKFCSGCYESSAEGDVPVVSTLPRPEPLALAAPAAPTNALEPAAVESTPALAESAPTNPAPVVEAPTNPPGTIAVKLVQHITPPENLKASPVVQEI